MSTFAIPKGNNLPKRGKKNNADVAQLARARDL